MEYFSLRSAIPRNWKEHLTKHVCPTISKTQTTFSQNNKILNIKQMLSKDFYLILVENFSDLADCSSIKKWQITFDINTDDFRKALVLPFKVCHETKYQAFQYKILHRFIPHNRLLHNMDLITSPYCNMCHDMVDTIEHRFFYCTIAREFWNHFRNWWNNIQPNSQCTLQCQDIIFGVYNTLCDTLNYCLLIGKYFIHTSIYSERKSFNFVQFKNLLKRKIEIIKHVCYTKGKQDYYLITWSLIANSLD